MIRIKKVAQTPGKEGMRTLENLISEGATILEGSKIILDLEQADKNLFFQDSERWLEFKHRYEDEFEGKINLMENIFTRKKKKVHVTWISVFND